MSNIILFYQNKLEANGKYGYYLSDILKWSDYRLEKEHDFIQWLFPDESGGVNPKAPKLTLKDVETFKSDKFLRRRVIRATICMLNFYGFTFVKNDVVQIKAIARKENGIVVGLHSTHNYRRITRIMSFLNRIELYSASSLFMLAMCYAMHKDLVLRVKIHDNDVLKYWFATQKYLRNYIGKYNLGSKIESEKKICRFTGLKYTGNSCYQDSVLLALLAIPNDFITENILERDMKSVSKMPNREIVYSCDEKSDCKTRRSIQKELVHITKSMRGEGEKVEYCSKLRSLFKTNKQSFHGTGMQDAGEFLQYLFAIFQVHGVVQSRTSMLTNKIGDIPIVNKKTIYETSPMVLIPSQNIIDNVSIETFLNHKEDVILDMKNLYRGADGVNYHRRIETVDIIRAEYLVFYAQRLYETKRNYNNIVPIKQIKLDNILNLFAIIVHRNYHYTCYIKCDKNWFYYNDLSDNIVYVGTYNDMLKTKPSVKSEGVLYFYKVD